MTSEQFEALVAKLEEAVRSNPARYKLKVVLLAFLGNVYLGFIVLVIVASFAAALASVIVLKAAAIKIIIPLGAFLWLVLKAVWIKFAPPQGIRIEKKQAPELFEMVEHLRKALDAPEFDQVLITDDFNAGVVQAPTMGIFGGYENYLLIGLPLMKGLTVDQFKAVLAHEFGHLAKGHGRLSNWIYTQRLRWTRLMGMLAETESKGSFLFRPFINWFAPYFNAYSFPLARANEYEADAASVRLTSPAAAAAALTNTIVLGSYLAEHYWPHIHQQANEHPQPSFTPYSSMGRRFSAELDEASVKRWLDNAMAMQTTLDDTHPALSERLEAIGEGPRLAPPCAGEAADQLLGDALHPIAETLDRRWKEAILPTWEQHYREVQDNRRRFAELTALHESGVELNVQDAYDRAWLTESVGNDVEAAFEQFRALHLRAPEDAVVCLALGIRLVGRNDETGLPLLEQAMKSNEDLIRKACQVLRDYHWQNGRKEEAHAWHARLEERTAIEQGAAKERGQVLTNDKFDCHDLTEDVVGDLITQLRAVSHLRKAYLVKKLVAHLPHRPCYVLGFTVTRRFWFGVNNRAADVLRQIQQTVQFPGETVIISVQGENYRFGRKFRWIRGARII